MQDLNFKLPHPEIPDPDIIKIQQGRGLLEERLRTKLPEPGGSMNLLDLIEDDQTILTRFSMWCQRENVQMRWKLSLNDKNFYVADLFIKDLRATATHRKRKIVRIMAARNMLRIIENDPTL